MAIERQNYRSAGYVEARSRANKSPSRSSKSRNTTSAGNQNTGNAREDYISNYVSKGIVKGGGTKKAGGGYHDATVSGDRGRTAKQEWVNSVNENNRRRAEASGTKFTPYKGGARTSSPYKGGGINGLIRLLIGAAHPAAGFLVGGFDKLKSGLGSLTGNINEALGDFREKRTGFRTQQEWEDARQNRIDNKRIQTIQNTLNKKYPDGDYSNTQLDERLAGLKEKVGWKPSGPNPSFQNDLDNELMLSTKETPIFSDPFANTVGTTTKVNTTNDAVSSTTPINNLQQRVDVMNQFDLPLNYSPNDLQAAAKRAMTQPGFTTTLAPYEKGVPEELQFWDGRPFTATAYDPYKVNTQQQGINTIDVGYPSNDLMAGLTKEQQKMLAGPQKNLRNILGISDEEILNNISPFNDPEDPATLEEVQTFYGADGGLASMFTRRG